MAPHRFVRSPGITSSPKTASEDYATIRLRRSSVASIRMSMTHHAVALDERGRRLGDEVFPTTRNAIPAAPHLVPWVRDRSRRSALNRLEHTLPARMARFLRAAEIKVIEVNHEKTEHAASPWQDVSAIDAEAAARKVLVL